MTAGCLGSRWCGIDGSWHVGSVTVDAGVRWDFLVSYTQADRGWAEWIAWELEEVGYRVLIQAWDIVAGSNWIQEMDRGVRLAARTVVVLSPDYLLSVYGRAEWQAAWAADPLGERSKLLPVRVASCDRPGLLGLVVSVDLFDLSEVAARRVLRDAVDGGMQGRVKPSNAPGFPGGARVVVSRPRFPGALPAVWNVPTRNPNFVGRGDELAELAAGLRSGGLVAVSALRGMGGVGKTQLAMEYAYQHAAGFDVVWWVRAEQAATVADQLAELGGRLGLPATGDVMKAAAEVVAALRAMPGWLLVFDNAEDPEEIRRWLPGGAGQVLVTTRRAGFRALGRVHEVDLLPRDEAVGLLRSRVPGLTVGVADRIAQLLGDLPLALEQAAAYMEKTDLPGGEYVSRLEARLTAMLDKGQAVGHEQRVATLWDMSYQRLAQEEPAAVVLLRVLAYLAPDVVPVDVFEPEGGMPQGLAELDVGRERVWDVIGALADYSLLRRTDATVSVHRLVQATVRRQVATVAGWDEPAWLDTLAALLLRARPAGDNARDPRTWDRWAALRPHITAVLAATDPATATTRTAVLDHWLGDYLSARGERAAARALFERLLDVRRRLLGDEDPSTLGTMHELAVLMVDRGERAAARALFEQVLDVRRGVLGDEHPHTLTTMNQLARVMANQGERAAARALYEQVLDVRRRVLGEEHPNTLTTMHNLAVVMADQGEWTAARALFEQVLDVRRRVLGEEHPDTLNTMHNLAWMMADQDERAAARALFEKVFDVRRRVLGDEHPDTLSTMHQLAWVMAAQGERVAARALYVQALDVRRRVLGDEHPDTLRTRHALVPLLEGAD
ncbi:FxSxx-COOH system tetratricopeptide repeat protein [Catellatospora tritici]|uniref:FxSxx-COOH system tetratricopeptide repeat protein n=1 Tax=Catellatospora tritici TaxID=2851566 RepID=UPI001C2DAA55|nr:FxSxx-COOH system tetratricopeptide repeat protein [Catellatospora tritici]MBV1849971.1 tetratricopeptide repeat protein [Catellatospora tritici]